LTITGYGFTSGNITASVDGVNCSVTQYQDSSFSCEVQPATSASPTNVSQAGQHGLRRQFYNHTSSLSLSTYSTYNYTESLNLNFEVPYYQDNYLANKMYGWFVAPATTAYRFYQTCDDGCTLKVANTSDNATDPATVIANNGVSSYRNFFMMGSSSTRKSEWINMTAGQHYYIEAEHVEYAGGDHMTVAVEIEQTAVIGHHHAMKEVQYLSVAGKQ